MPAPARTCPNCSSALVPAAIGAEHVDVCPSCWGVFFDRDEGRLFEKDEQRREVVAAARFAPGRCSRSGHPMSRAAGAQCARCAADAARCPACAERFGLLAIRGNLIDVCERCEGIWLDAGELQAFLDAEPVMVPRTEWARLPPPPQVPPRRRMGFFCAGCDERIGLHPAWTMEGELFCARCRPDKAQETRFPAAGGGLIRNAGSGEAVHNYDWSPAVAGDLKSS